MSLRVLHLSDFHTGKDDYGQLALFDTILEEVGAHCDKDAPPHIVLITGDIANHGLDSEYRLFLETFLGPLRAKLDAGIAVPVFLVPGNHDVERSQCPTTVAYGHADTYAEYFDPTSRGFELRKPSLPRFAAYHRFLEGADLDGQRFDGEASYYAVELAAGGINVGVVGLNSAWLSQDPVDRGTLYGGKAGNWEERECLTPGLSALDAGLRDVEASVVTLVVCHHPVSWLRLEEQDRIRARLGQYRVLYAHGHLHRTQSRVGEGVGRLFRGLQAGAAFQARADSIWRNRFCWYEIEPTSLEVLAEPLTWDANQHSWVVDGDAYPPVFREGNRWRLPGFERETGAARWAPPRGSIVVSEEYLASSKQGLSDNELVFFFDGAIPTWRHVLSDRIPRRFAVSQLVHAYSVRTTEPGSPIIRLITGAGGEGKSTLLLQTTVALVQSPRPWRVLFLAAPDALLSVEDLLNLPSGAKPWLVVADDAERVAGVCAKAARALWESGRRDIHFLLAARDTDWRALGADKTLWHEFSDFAELALRGLSPGDAEAVVQAWQLLGARGLGRLAETPPAERVNALIRAVTEHGARTEGSFFGGALELRLGQGLRDHVLSLLNRLAERPGTGPHSLMDALVLIAAPHSLNVLTLTLDILAEALGSTPLATRRHVLIPLGEEAAAVEDGRFILTRHRAVAQAIMNVASQQFGVEDVACLEVLVRSVNRLRPTTFMPGFNDFNYLSRRLREELGRPDDAVRLACVLVQAEPRNRQYLHELGVCFGQQGLDEGCVCASLASIADMPGDKPPTNANAKMALATIGLSFGRLRDRTGNLVFARGLAAAVNLGFRLKLDRVTRAHFERHEASIETEAEVPLRSSVDALIAAAQAAWPAAESGMPAVVQKPSALKFKGLAKLCGVS